MTEAMMSSLVNTVTHNTQRKHDQAQVFQAATSAGDAMRADLATDPAGKDCSSHVNRHLATCSLNDT